MTKRTVLNDTHRALGAKMVDFGGWDTLAVRIYSHTTEGLWQQAAWPALWLVAVGLLPVWWLVRQQR